MPLPDSSTSIASTTGCSCRSLSSSALSCIHALRYLGGILFSSGIAPSDLRLGGPVPLTPFVSFVSLACLNSFLRGPMTTLSSSPSPEPTLAPSLPLPFSFLLASFSFSLSCSTVPIARNISTTPSISGPATAALAVPTSSAPSIPPLHGPYGPFSFALKPRFTPTSGPHSICPFSLICAACEWDWTCDAGPVFLRLLA
jgi:hypothetical protein